MKDNGIVLFCYPKANTGGCTTQAVGLSEKSAELAAAGFKVYGISADKPKSQANWKKKADITCTLLCDPTYEVRKIRLAGLAVLYVRREHQVSYLGHYKPSVCARILLLLCTTNLVTYSSLFH